MFKAAMKLALSRILGFLPGLALVFILMFAVYVAVRILESFWGILLSSYALALVIMIYSRMAGRRLEGLSVWPRWAEIKPYFLRVILFFLMFIPLVGGFILFESLLTFSGDLGSLVVYASFFIAQVFYLALFVGFTERPFKDGLRLACQLFWKCKPMSGLLLVILLALQVAIPVSLALTQHGFAYVLLFTPILGLVSWFVGIYFTQAVRVVMDREFVGRIDASNAFVENAD